MKFFQKNMLIRLMSVWPPFLGAGIRVRRVSGDFREVEVEMKLRWWNRNYVGTHFGGSLYAMTDPYYMLMLIENLGPEYIVWDKKACIEFKRPGRGTVRAKFYLTQERIEEIRHAANHQPKVEPEFKVEVADLEGNIIAVATKLLYVKKKTV